MVANDPEPCPVCNQTGYPCGPNGEDCDITRSDWIEMNADMATTAINQWIAEDKERGRPFTLDRGVNDRGEEDDTSNTS